ncbi:WecB/TagA/CpsF family glycosyltransferase [Novosphingobium aquimarinum]|uniref:WecB/TagA/CpsF family glycosyltransferase n=1 Tax=Novosphingobium aquimarinum TaxID=2682494 RepID=UPI0012ECAC86|nr:WecB/TagA/CpsF family glycosyltransferase [Novosphingobium aquimarinum]
MKYNHNGEFDTVDVATLLSKLGSTRAEKTVTLFGQKLVNAKREDMAVNIVTMAARGRATTINFANAHCINTMYRDMDYSRALASSDRILPDGSGMAIAARMAGVELGENLNGTDLFPEICRVAEQQGQGIFLLGGGHGIADAAAAWAARTYPELNISGTWHGFFSAADEDHLIERINRSGASILFVGLGVPLQEKWIARNRHRIDVPVILGVGGLFDYYSGRIARAPKAVRAVGCEWVWRLAMEPRRLANRYLLGNAIFLAHAANHALECRGVFDRASIAARRGLDLAVATVALLIFMPMFLLVALAIKLEDGGPIFFRQTRIGERGRNFKMIKFRSMYVDAEQRRAQLLAQSERDDTCFKMKHDPRITRVGRFIRRTSIDELPQLINVLTGEMSLVGPRPALPSEVATYTRSSWRRLGGKPGITCIWQVSGRAEIPFKRQVAMDRMYLRRRGIVTDVILLALTVPAVVSGRGAY